jgi:hypothetical protein
MKPNVLAPKRQVWIKIKLFHFLKRAICAIPCCGVEFQYAAQGNMQTRRIKLKVENGNRVFPFSPKRSDGSNPLTTVKRKQKSR